jgi:hypothetical protein
MSLNFQRKMISKYWSEYTATHRWVHDTLGKATYCSKDLTHKSKNFEWANVSGEYKREKNDWIQLCQSCHRKRDWTEDQKEILRKRNMGNKYHVRKIMQKDLSGNLIKEWETGRAVAQFLGVCPSTVTNIINSKTKIAGGYIWL